MTKPETTTTDPSAKLHALISGIDDAMLVTSDAHGHPHARPMRIVAFDESTRDDLWFVSYLDSTKIEEIRTEPRVCVSMANGARFISMTGYADIVLDKRKLGQMWRSEWGDWMPEGPTSDALALIQVRPLYVEYWDQSMSNRVRFAVEAAKAWWKDEAIEAPEGPEYHANLHYG